MGSTALSVQLRAGDYDAWFFRAVGHEGVRFETVQLHLGQKLPDPAGFDAVMITGSPLSMTDPAEWMRQAAERLRRAADRGTPILGVCFGHQLLGYAWGGRVVRSDRGREIGSVEIALTPEGRKDPLFEGLPDRFIAQTTHEDVVENAPPGTTLLAGNAHSPVQALAFSPRVRGVQFHPELSPDTMRAVVEARAAQLGTPERVERLLQGIRPSSLAMRVLQNFLTHLT